MRTDYFAAHRTLVGTDVLARSMKLLDDAEV